MNTRLGARKPSPIPVLTLPYTNCLDSRRPSVIILATMSSLADALGTLPELLVPVCAHVSKHGLRCDRAPIEGDVICVLHGASLPLAREHGQRRLLALQAKSIAVLEELFVSADDKVRLTAAIAVLDRTGYGPKSTVAVEQTGVDLSNLDDDQILHELDSLAKTARDEQTRQRMNEAQLSIAPLSASDIRH